MPNLPCIETVLPIKSTPSSLLSGRILSAKRAEAAEQREQASFFLIVHFH